VKYDFVSSFRPKIYPSIRKMLYKVGPGSRAIAYINGLINM